MKVINLPAILLFLATTIAGQAQFTYSTTNGAVIITGYTGDGGAVTVPETIDELPVTCIGDKAFSQKGGVTSIALPNSVFSIGQEAFALCGLTNLTIPSSVRSIGSGAFYRCYGLTSVAISGSVTNLGDGSFYNCSGLANVTIGNGVTTIPHNMFYACSALASVAIPESVTSVGSWSFEDCSGLTNVTIPNGVTTIGQGAFFGCASLPNITIPASATNIGEGAFSRCWNLAAIEVASNNPAYSTVDAALFDKLLTTLVEYPAGKGASYTIPEGVTTIGNGAFEWSGLTAITIPTSVTSIGNNSFNACVFLASVTIPSSVTNIGDSAFAQCSTLASVFFQGDAPATGSSVFYSYGDRTPTIYFLSSAIGWGTSFASCLTAVWLPQVQVTDGDFGVRTNQFGFNISWASGQIVVVEACANLSNPAWFPVATNTVISGSSYFSDAQWTNYPSRFYRLRSP